MIIFFSCFLFSPEVLAYRTFPKCSCGQSAPGFTISKGGNSGKAHDMIQTYLLNICLRVVVCMKVKISMMYLNTEEQSVIVKQSSKTDFT